MDFLSDFNSQKIVIIVVIISLLIAAYLYLTNKKSNQHNQLNQSRQQLPPPSLPVPQPETGNTLIDQPDKMLVLFYSPQCGHCRNMAPAWDEFMQNFDGYNGVRIVQVNGAEQQQLCQLHGIQGFPTVKFCPNGVESPEGLVYNGDRSVDSLAQFLQQLA